MNSLGLVARNSVVRLGVDCKTPATAGLSPTVRGDIADVPQDGEGTCLPSCLQ